MNSTTFRAAGSPRPGDPHAIAPAPTSAASPMMRRIISNR
jgi:hypothetical protein